MRSIGCRRLDPEAIKATGKKYEVSTIFGSKQWDTTTGATIWTNSRQG